MKWFSRVYFLLTIAAALAIVSLALPAAADSIVQSFKASDSVQPGWVVSVKPSAADTVELAPANQSQLIYGVAIDPSQAPVTLQRQPGDKVFIASSGTYPVLVSTQNGGIKIGDYLSISSTNGVAAKATDRQIAILGQALEKFDGTSGVLASGSGEVKVGKINVGISPGRNPLLKSDITIPGALKKVGDNLAGKDTSLLRIYMALGVFLIAAVVALNITVVGIRGAMTAIGRNPLSRHSIMGSLVQVIIVALSVLLLGAFSVYLLLKL